MPGDGSARSSSWLDRLRWPLRLTALGLLLFGPIATTAWQLRPPSLEYPPVDASSDAVRTYLAKRSPLVDRLLPEGSGGTAFFSHLDGNAVGMAFTGTAAVGLTPEVESGAWAESIELHERAHLVDAFLPGEVARVMARVASPDPSMYAAKNPGEHFAEMAARAWEIVVPPDGICVDGTPVERLRAIEAQVPGTAGFVGYYLRQPALEATDGRDDLRDTARVLAAPAWKEWQALWRALEVRRLADGTFERWPAPTVREVLDLRRRHGRASGTWSGRLLDVGLAPSEAVLRLAGR